MITKFNFTFIGQFIAGIGCMYLAYRIFQEGNSGGFLFKSSKGLEAQVNAFLLAGVGVYLLLLPFRVDSQKAVTWRDIFFALGLIISTEVVAHFIALVIS